MRRNLFCTIALTAVIILMGACNDTAWDDLSTPIQNFISEYFPAGKIESQNVSDGIITVQIKNSATLRFDTDGSWTEVNGNGVPLPGNFLFDQLPSVLYSYLEETEKLGEVFRVTRDWKEYSVELHNTSILYDIATRTITYPSADTSPTELLTYAELI